LDTEIQLHSKVLPAQEKQKGSAFLFLSFLTSKKLFSIFLTQRRGERKEEDKTYRLSLRLCASARVLFKKY
jgi:hypothetical protein